MLSALLLRSLTLYCLFNGGHFWRFDPSPAYPIGEQYHCIRGNHRGDPRQDGLMGL